MIEGEAEYKGELVSLEETKNSLLTQAPSVTPMRATFSSADSVQNGSGVINAIHYRSAASLPLGGRLSGKPFTKYQITSAWPAGQYTAHLCEAGSIRAMPEAAIPPAKRVEDRVASSAEAVTASLREFTHNIVGKGLRTVRFHTKIQNLPPALLGDIKADFFKLSKNDFLKF